MDYRDLLNIDATLVANEFLDKYMPKANGEFVKVYLYLLKNQVNGIDISTIADNLELTEGDVRRALKYWEAQGILTRGEKGRAEAEGNAEANAAKKAGKANKTVRLNAAEEAAESDETALLDREELRRAYKRADGAKALSRLSSDAEFAQLLFVVQKYMSKILTDSEQQVFAYLYDGLNMPCDVLEYLVEYCVQTGHKSIRYIETVGLDWVDSGIRDVKSAKRRTKAFDRKAEKTAQRRQTQKSKLGVRSGTDYDAIILEQVVKKMEQ